MSRAKPWIVHEDRCPIERWEGPDGRRRVEWRTLLSGDRTPTSSLTLGVAEIEPDRPDAFRLHRHAQPEVYYILSGEGVVVIDGSEHRVRPGSAVFIPGDLEHGVRNTGPEPLRLLYAFAVDSFHQVEYVFSPAPADA